jgi:AcrR family transcriptional regulator
METSSKGRRGPRSDNRLPELLDAAAHLFAKHGYAATSMRDIAQEVKMLAGSVYYHFPSKDDLLLAVYAAGVKALDEACVAAMARESEPWARLESLCCAHLETVLCESDYAHVLIRVLPSDLPKISDRLRDLRANHERLFREAITALPLPADADRRAIRLMLIGALNWAPFWFDLQGRDSPRDLARKFVGLIKEKPHGETTPSGDRDKDRL